MTSSAPSPEAVSEVDEVDVATERRDTLLAAVARIPARDLHDEWQPPAELDEYHLLRPLGRGGMGSVWLARDTLLDRLVAVKFVAHTPTPRMRERFAIEARAAARLSHSNVVTVHRYGEIAGRPYLVSEYIRGNSLDKIAKPIEPERALELGIALARGLAATHRQGIVHRDIKPANAIVTADGDVKLVDFGLAKLQDAALAPAARRELARARAGAPVPAPPTLPGSASACDAAVSAPRVSAPWLDCDQTTVSDVTAEDRAPRDGSGDLITRAGAITGTPLYLAPEVRAGAAADRRSDVYQLGCILYELLTGRAPLFDIPGGSAAARDRDVPSLTPRVGARFAAVVDRCLRRDPDARFASGDDLRDALERIAEADPRGQVPEGNPYRGLLAFDAEHRAVFFGRGAEIRAVTERLRADPFVLVTGDSGVGKSSLCRAGVLPGVVDGALGRGAAWLTLSIVPGRRPLATLASALAPVIGVDEAGLSAALRDQPAALVRALRRGLGTARCLLIFVDQLEELTTVAEREDAAAFGRVLGQLAAGTPGVRVLATARGDFVTRLAEVPGLGDEISRALYVLRPLTAAAAREAVTGPARATGAQFESDEVVDALVPAVAAGDAAVELPLLAFTLSALWDARDPATQMISARSLDAIGGVRGALARHADGVLDGLVPSQRAAARQVLLRLVTPERTRIRRTAAELTEHRAVLDALVRGRLVVARGDEPPTFELAHERLIDSWPALAGWLSEDAAALAMHRRLATAVANWEQLERSNHALWRERQLAELAILAGGDLSPSEAAFAAASRRAVRRRRALRIGLAVAVPLVIAAIYGSARLVAGRDIAHRIADKVAEADRALGRARAASADGGRLQSESFAKFDADDDARGEALWDTARKRDAEAADAYAQASRALEAAVLYDSARGDVRRRLAAITFERIALADRDHRRDERDELVNRLALYDDGTFARRLVAPGQLAVAVDPPGATAVLVRDRSGDATEQPVVAGALDVPPGSYVLVASAPDRATVRMPLVVRAGEHQRVAFELPPAAAIPAGLVYIPPGRFLYGSREPETLRNFLGAAPMHERTTAAFLIAVTEVTYAQWIEFLDDLPPAEQARRAPLVANSSTQQGDMALRNVRGTWELHIAPASVAYRVPAGTPLEYPDRAVRARQDWLRFPVSGISFDDAQAYTAWLDRTGRVPRARLCHDPEWERAMRGADGRIYPHGERMARDDANVDVTYGRREGGFGPDEVGAHPISNSPFELADGSGNVWEMVRSSTGVTIRGGSFFNGAFSSHLANREAFTIKLRHILTGLRICADPP
jgi:serine/threonine protein kinase/formylglycine-generating enzyme required for sulfatase activity